MKFTVEHQSGSARAGRLETDHGVIETPIFMPVGTQATVKAVEQEALKTDIDAPIILGNTYHLFLRPGLEILQEAGGLHGFMNWDRALLTDSGGYQVYSISDQRKINEEGVLFRSHIDGSKHLFTPENVMDTQRIIGADIIMAFDECTPYPCDLKYATDSMHMTHRWLDRCVARMSETEPVYGHEQALFPIVQGSVYPELRKQSAEYVLRHDTVGYAIGGLSVGEPHEDMYAMTELVCDILPKEKPRYLMGVGTPENILTCIELGIDMFDCVMPTRNARNGQVFTTQGILNLRNARWAHDFNPLDPELTPEYSKAYLRHLTIAGEYLSGQIASKQNLRFYLWLVRQARQHIIEGDYSSWKAAIVPQLMTRL
ncbi:MAG: tRNA guanosine(34) transglycosylase Tgt [Flavobacteriales bacterium]|nr:tRNA guanosine(34) transglycosylase Tgt [Bacteroidota bacterium]MCB9239996.1 tRNA guanosine(34) transglycosylase Tgt [Flavobacteriales bacterium]